MNVRTMPRLAALPLTLALAASLLSGCASGVSSSLNGNGITSAAVSVPVLITDAPADQLISFSLTLNTIVLTDSAGKTTSILSTPTTIEVTHLNGIQAPLVTASIPADTYTSALITFSSPQITYINSTGTAVVAAPVLASTSFTATFPTPITISNASGSLLFDLLAAQSVAISGTTVTVTPVFSVKPLPPAPAPPTQSQNGTGQQQFGTIVSVSGNSLVVEPASGSNITLTTNSSTLLQGFTALSSLTAGELVQVDFIIQSGGVYLATRIQLAPPPPNGQPPINLLSGFVTTVSPGTAFKLAVVQGAGPGVSPTATGAVDTVTDTGATFAITPQFVSLAGLPFTPSFSITNITAGQTVAIVASSLTGTNAVAANVYLVPQTLGGTVTAITTAGTWTAYTLTLNSGSAFATLSGATTITVYTNTNTAPPPSVTSPPAIVVGSTARFNGLVFATGSGKFSMVAGCSPDGAPGI